MLWTTVVSIVVLCLVQGYDGQTVVSGRLPGNTEPRSYVLRVEPNLKPENASFAGSVDITVAVMTATSTITLNSKGLVLHDIRVTDENTDRDINVHSWSYAEDREQVVISMDGHVLANRRYTIRIRFEGILRDDGTGFFKSGYETDSDGKKWIAATQFQTTLARSTFPCYDEPNFRTPFNISIKVKENEIALSNMPVIDTIHVDEILANGSVEYHSRKWVHFAQTPCMSTSSVAFFVGEFEKFDNTRLSEINVYSHLGRLYQIEYMTKAAPDILGVMENYTGIPYAMPELNLLAVPILGLGQFENNWGLTTYREKTLFVDMKTNSRAIMSAKTAVGHAVATQWFGNLVTPAQWDFAWLNKGLATYLEYFATATLEPEWRLEHFFIVDQQRQALDDDRNQIRPLSAPAIMPGEADYYTADRLSGQKAAAIMMMLNDWVGEEVFKTSINMYLTHNQYTAVKPEKLWNAFDNVLFDRTKSGLNGNSVRTVMNTWTEQAGYPVVNVIKKDKSLVLTQQRFLSGFTESNDTSKWFIRLSYTTNKEKNFDTKSAPTVWLNPFVNETVIPIDDDVEWYIFNVQSTGFYRVNYTEDNWLSLIKQLNDSPKEVHILNRAQLIDDSFSLAKAGLLNYKIPMSFTQYLEKEDDIIPWFSAMNSLNYILNRMRRCRNALPDVKAVVSNLSSSAFKMFNKLVAEQKSPKYPINVGWNTFATWACKLDEYIIYRTSTVPEYFRRWKNGEEIPADIKDAAFCVGARQSQVSGSLDKLLHLYNTTKTYSERASVINALPCADIQTLLTYLTLIMEDKCPIEPSDYEDFFNALSSTSNGITAMNYFLGKYFTDLVKNVKNGRNIATTIYSILAAKASTESEIENIMEMAFRSNTPVEYRNTLVPVYRREIEDNVKWYDNGSPEAIWEYINPLSKGLALDPSQQYTTPQSTSEDDSSASSRLHNYAIILQILALSLSVKLLVNVI
ncbi:aminopeptidase N-like [Metopolophium dirhodum]|uniref:aminopeptidase N-like n=1 Tax=Metopolophium dirhodum TaxID=44670 RepID=UPI00298FDC90|nr:aminopeptidase N-like [Metopolophium dirhodum]